MAGAQAALGLALLALALAYAGAQNKNTHLFVLTPPPVLLPAPRRFSLTRTDHGLANTDTCIAGEPWPVDANRSLTCRRQHRLHSTLHSTRHERILIEFFSALLCADDLELLERPANASGLAYLDIDTNFSMSRPPVLLRGKLRELMRKYNMTVIPVQHTWTPVERHSI